MAITVHFLGICTYVWWEGITPRVVLVNAAYNTPIQDENIGPHIPTLRIAAKDIADMDPLSWPGTSATILEWRLNGTRLSIDNGTIRLDRHSSFANCMPSLQDLVPDIGPPSKSKVVDGDRKDTACIFELTHGRLSCGVLRKEGAVFSRLWTETEGRPRLSITAFGSDQPQTITLQDDIEITIANLGVAERPHDFYLHYLLAETTPEVMSGPRPTKDTCYGNPSSSPTWSPGFGSVDAGCSNSIYP